MNDNPYQQPAAPQSSAPVNAVYDKGKAGMVLGILGLVFSLLPIIGLPINIVGLVFSAKSLDSPSRGKARAGVIMASIGVVLTIINAAVGAYLGAKGQLFK